MHEQILIEENQRHNWDPFGAYNVPDLQAAYFSKGAKFGGKWFTGVKDQFFEDEVDKDRKIG